MVGFLVFTAVPMLASLVLSFTDYSLVGDTHAVGADNYRALLDDPRVATSLANTFVYAALFVPVGTVVALGPPCCSPESVGRAASSERPSTCPR